MIVDAIGKSIRSLFSPAILFTLVLPFFIASIVWIIVLWAIWGMWSGFIGNMALFDWMMKTFGEGGFIEWFKVFVIFIVTILIFGPLWYLTFILIISVFLFPMLLPRIQKLYYPALEKKKGGSTVGSVRNTLVASVVFVIGFFLSLPLWLFTPFAPAATLFLTAYLNKQVFSYDVLQDYASAEEAETLKKKYSSEIWATGFVTAFLIWIPLANIIAPALTALVFIHYFLGRLEEERTKGT